MPTKIKELLERFSERKPQTQSLKTLLDKARDGKLIIPELQRQDKAWNMTGKVNFLNAIMRDSHIQSIGSITTAPLSYIASEAEREEILGTSSPFRGASLPYERKDIRLLIDGQHRLSTLLSATHNFEGERPFVLNLETGIISSGELIKENQLASNRSQSRKKLFLHDLLGPNQVALTDLLRLKQISPTDVIDILNLRAKILDIEVAVHESECSNIEDLYRVFYSINTGGVNLTKIDLFSSHLSTSVPGSVVMLRGFEKQVSPVAEWQKYVSEKYILYRVAGALKHKQEITRISPKELKKPLPRTPQLVASVNAIITAAFSGTEQVVRAISELGLEEPSLLTSGIVRAITPLAVLCSKTFVQSETLKKLLVLSIFNESKEYQQQTATDLITLALAGDSQGFYNKMVSLVTSDGLSFYRRFLNNPVATLRQSHEGQVDTKILRLIMRIYSYSQDIPIFDLESTSNYGDLLSDDWHHIFPDAYLTELGGFDLSVRNHPLNYVLATRAANESIKDKNPFAYIPNLLVPSMGSGVLSANSLPDANDVVWSDYSKYLDFRAKAFAPKLVSYFSELVPKV